MFRFSGNGEVFLAEDISDDLKEGYIGVPDLPGF